MIFIRSPFNSKALNAAHQAYAKLYVQVCDSLRLVPRSSYSDWKHLRSTTVEKREKKACCTKLVTEQNPIYTPPRVLTWNHLLQWPCPWGCEWPMAEGSQSFTHNPCPCILLLVCMILHLLFSLLHSLILSKYLQLFPASITATSSTNPASLLSHTISAVTDCQGWECCHHPPASLHSHPAELWCDWGKSDSSRVCKFWHCWMLYLAVCMRSSMRMLLEVLVLKKVRSHLVITWSLKNLIGSYFALSPFLSLSSAAAVSAA